MEGKRYLIVTADDFGIGPATSQGIVDLAVQKIVQASVLLVTSPYAKEAVKLWHKLGEPFELGWHPCLTLDGPVAGATRVPSLVREDGTFWPLGQFVRRLALGQIRSKEIALELEAQYCLFRDLVGRWPTVVNSHHHVQIFPPVGDLLCQLLKRQCPLPYIRRVREPWSMLARVPGARLKRLFLSVLGARDSQRQEEGRLPGNDWLAGVTDPPCVANSAFFTRWLSRVPGQIVELTCHPGHLDTTLIGRDCTAHDGQLQRRVRELELLEDPGFRTTCRQAGFEIVSPGELLRSARTTCHAA